MPIRMGVDIGGTFTDFCLVNEDGGRIFVDKRLTTPHDPSEAVLNGFREMLARHNIQTDEVDGFVHGSTLVTNSVIERRGARTAMLVSRGFADLLDIGFERRYDLFDLRLRFPVPLVPRKLRLEVDERASYDGTIQRPLTDGDKEKALAFIRENRIEAVAICFLHAYVNPTHERDLAEYLTRNAPDLYVSTSSGVFPYIREYERWTTTTMNAFVQPVVDRYLGRLENTMREWGFRGNFHIVTSSGGTITPKVARQFPVRMLESGPAAGVLMAAFIGRSIGKPDLLSYDMGGTTAKGALVRRYSPAKKYDMEVARVHGFKKGSGLPAKFPTIDMIEIGSGGGSIASIDERGVLRMGPRSAGADPGPACYGRDGPYATLTDANLVLGYLDPSFFLGGKMRLDKAASEKVIGSTVATPLGIEVARAAWGMHEIINEDVARAFRVHASERGFDYRQCSMVAFGGSGPAHALRVARKLRIPAVVFPVGAGVMSAFGMLASPLSFETARTYRVGLNPLDEQALEHQFRELVDEAAGFLIDAGLARDQISVTRRLDMRFCGQGYEIEIDLPPTSGDVRQTIAGLFKSKYEQIFGNPPIEAELEILNWKVEVRGPQPTILDSCRLVHESRKTAPKASRKAYFPEAGGFIDCAVYDRYQLIQGRMVQGPALIEEDESTCVIGVNDRATVDARGNIIAYLDGSESPAGVSQNAS